jgi:subtilisin-like proprotein convertase family protein
MQSNLWTGILLSLTLLLTSCGGGSSSPATTQQPGHQTCDSTTLWAAHPATSGRAIPDNDSTGVSVSWDNQNCTIRTTTSATIEICLSHARTSDLSWSITPPGGFGALTFTHPANWNTTGTACGLDQGKLQRIDLLPKLTSALNTRGIWTLHVKDQQLGDTGTLIQWRLLIQGTD